MGTSWCGAKIRRYCRPQSQQIFSGPFFIPFVVSEDLWIASPRTIFIGKYFLYRVYYINSMIFLFNSYHFQDSLIIFTIYLIF